MTLTPDLDRQLSDVSTNIKRNPDFDGAFDFVSVIRPISLEDFDDEKPIIAHLKGFVFCPGMFRATMGMTMMTSFCLTLDQNTPVTVTNCLFIKGIGSQRPLIRNWMS
jgi:hypothetical protein